MRHRPIHAHHAVPRRLPNPTLLLLLALSAPISAQQAEDPPRRPLNLSLPRDAVWSSPLRPDVQPAEPARGDAPGLPDLGSRPGAGGRMPYGSGYEARQRGGAGDGSGQHGAGSGGGGRQGGAGHGMGRGTGRGR
jgi:hypothetical protein